MQKALGDKIRKIGVRSGDAQKVLDYMYLKPIVDAKIIGSITEKTLASAYKLISTMEELEIIKEITGLQRGRLYIFKDYIDLFKT